MIAYDAVLVPLDGSDFRPTRSKVAGGEAGQLDP
jgi:hypothetical protein